MELATLDLLTRRLAGPFGPAFVSIGAQSPPFPVNARATAADSSSSNNLIRALSKSVFLKQLAKLLVGKHRCDVIGEQVCPNE